MFVRKVSARLQPDSLAEFANLLELEILPWLQKQEGFRDLIVLAAPDGREVATLSFWDDSRNARAYGASGYPEVLKILEDLLDGAPYVKTFIVVSPMPQMIRAASARECRAGEAQVAIHRMVTEIEHDLNSGERGS